MRCLPPVSVRCIRAPCCLRQIARVVLHITHAAACVGAHFGHFANVNRFVYVFFFVSLFPMRLSVQKETGLNSVTTSRAELRSTNERNRMHCGVGCEAFLNGNECYTCRSDLATTEMTVCVCSIYDMIYGSPLFENRIDA